MELPGLVFEPGLFVEKLWALGFGLWGVGFRPSAIGQKTSQFCFSLFAVVVLPQLIAHTTALSQRASIRRASLFDGSISVMAKPVENNTPTARQPAAALAADAERIGPFVLEALGEIREAIWLLDWEKKQPIYVSPSFEQLFGRSRSSLVDVPQQWEMSLHPDDRAKVLAAMEQGAEHGNFDVEYRVVWPDGTVRWVHDRATPIRDESGRVVRMVGVAQDVTSQHAVMAELEQFFLMSRDMFIMASLDGFFRKINPALSRTLGWSNDDLTNKPFIDFVHPDDKAMTLEALTGLANGKDVDHFENRYQCADGSYRVLSWTVPAPPPGHNLMFAIARDVTEQWQAREALRQSEEQYRRIVETADEGIWIIDNAMVTTFANRRMEELLGIEPGKLVGRKATDFVFADDLKEAAAEMDRRRAGERTRREWRMRRVDGEEVFVIAAAQPILDDRGEFVGALAMMSDITQRHKAEQAIISSEQFLQAVIDGLSDHIAVLDETGVITAVNEAWRKFGHRSGLTSSSLDVGSNYILVCESAQGSSAEETAALASGIRRVLHNDINDFTMEYPSPNDGEQRWFAVRVTSFHHEGRRWAAVAHEDITARKAADEAVLRSERNWRTLTESAPSIIFTIDADLRLQYINHTAPGYRIDEVIGRHALEFVPDEEKMRLRTIFERVLETGVMESYEIAGLGADNSTAWYTSTVAPITLKDNQPGLIVHSIDITKRKTIEEAVRDSERQLRTVLESLPVAVSFTDKDGNVIMQNSAAIRLIAAIPALGASASASPASAHTTALSRALHEGVSSTNKVLNLPNPRGEMRTIMHSAVPVKDEQGLVVGALTLREDITDDEQLKALLKESEQRFRQVAENMHEVFWLSDAATGEMIYVSPAFAAVWGRHQDFAQRNRSAWIETIHPDDRERMASLYNAATEYDEQYRIIRPDGSVRWVRDRAFPVRDARMLIQRVAGIIEDITDRIEAAERERRHHGELVHFGRLSIMGEMAAGFAHELNQPLAAIANYARGSIRRLESGESDHAAIVDAMRQAAQQAERAGEIIRKLRNLAHKRDSKRAPVSINQLVQDAVALTEMEPRAAQVALRLVPGRELPNIWADTIQIEQVLLNLLRNANDAVIAAGKPGGSITITTSQPNSSVVQVSVADTGIGLPPDRDGLFQPFFTTKDEGLGIGLSLSHSIIVDHGGRLWAEPNPGGGAVFRFELPLDPPDGQDQASPHHQELLGPMSPEEPG